MPTIQDRIRNLKKKAEKKRSASINKVVAPANTQPISLAERKNTFGSIISGKGGQKIQIQDPKTGQTKKDYRLNNSITVNRGMGLMIVDNL